MCPGEYTEVCLDLAYAPFSLGVAMWWCTIIKLIVPIPPSFMVYDSFIVLFFTCMLEHRTDNLGTIGRAPKPFKSSPNQFRLQVPSHTHLRGR